MLNKNKKRKMRIKIKNEKYILKDLYIFIYLLIFYLFIY